MTSRKIYAKSVSSAVLIGTLLLTAPLSAVAEGESGEPTEPVGKALVEKKCTICHSTDRVYAAEKTHSEWEQTIAKMMRYSDQMDFLNQQERDDIIDFLINRKKSDSDRKI
ncbi:MAG: hypothetical protein D3906_02180 [Candidatus Electrothrix sp. AUS1_2]|nr:hypothetical protein [Candidatus Electrothrix sp. AUS1_2]